MTKSEIRAEMRARRRALPPVERAAECARICRRLAAMDLSSPVAAYLASPDEVDLTSFLAGCMARHVPVAVPRWNGSGYDLALLDGCWPQGLAAGPHGILEPPVSAPLLAAGSVGTWLVPGLAFAADGTRLGYGGGWYDRLLSGADARSVKLGVGFAFQRVDTLPAEPHDVRLDGFVGPAGFSAALRYRCGGECVGRLDETTAIDAAGMLVGRPR